MFIPGFRYNIVSKPVTAVCAVLLLLVIVHCAQSQNAVSRKGKVHHRTGHESTEREYSYSCTLSLTSALEGVGGQRHAPPLYPRERPGTHCVGGWVGRRSGLDRCG